LRFDHNANIRTDRFIRTKPTGPGAPGGGLARPGAGHPVDQGPTVRRCPLVENPVPRHRADHRQLQQLVAAVTDGVILVEPDQTITWANAAALRMHGVERMEELGGTVSEYRERFELRYRNRHRLPSGQYPMERVLAGEAFDEVLVEVAPAGEEKPRWTHRIRSMVLTDAEGRPDCLALVLDDATERFDAEGNLTDGETREYVRRLLQSLVDWTRLIGSKEEAVGDERRVARRLRADEQGTAEFLPGHQISAG
jgi:hypothetical protein